MRADLRREGEGAGEVVKNKWRDNDVSSEKEKRL